MDTAVLVMKNQINELVNFQYRYSECYKCCYNSHNISSMSNETFNLNTNWLIEWVIKLDTVVICNKSINLRQSVNYEYIIQRRSMMSDSVHEYNCTLNYVSAEIMDFLLPIYVLLVILFLLFTIYLTTMTLYRKRIIQGWASRLSMYKVDLHEDLGSPNDTGTVVSEDEALIPTKLDTVNSRKKRVKSIDTFRGISIVLMVFVNYGGGGYWFFEHSSWNGLTAADLVFPWFVFVMGATTTITQLKSIRLNKTYRSWLFTWLIATKRSVVLFILGLFLESRRCKGDLYNMRIMGPLQRLAIAYWCLLSCFCIFTHLLRLRKQLRLESRKNTIVEVEIDVNGNERPQSWLHSVKELFPVDVIFSWPYLLIAAGLCVGHICISLYLIVPDCPRGYLGPGGISDCGRHANCTGGAACYIDDLILKPNHMYKTPTTTKLYKTEVPFDPEGILGNMTSLALCLLGFWSGNILLFSRNYKTVICKLLVIAIIYLSIGIGLCECQKNEGLIPINKNLWSVSFVMVTAATSQVILCVLFVSIDLFRLWSGEPFRICGQNAIAIYIGHTLSHSLFPVQFNVPNCHTYRLMMDVWGTLFWVLVAAYMHRKRLFFTV